MYFSILPADDCQCIDLESRKKGLWTNYSSSRVRIRIDLADLVLAILVEQPDLVAVAASDDGQTRPRQRVGDARLVLVPGVVVGRVFELADRVVLVLVVDVDVVFAFLVFWFDGEVRYCQYDASYLFWLI